MKIYSVSNQTADSSWQSLIFTGLVYTKGERNLLSKVFVKFVYFDCCLNETRLGRTQSWYYYPETNNVSFAENMSLFGMEIYGKGASLFVDETILNLANIYLEDEFPFIP